MQLLIYQGNSKQLAAENTLDNLLQKLPISLHERALRYRLKEDAFNFVLGRLLLKKGLKALDLKHQLEDIQYQETGKPYLDGVFFNISHSDDLVVCAVSLDGDFGIDVEKVRPISLDNFRAWFTDKEWADIARAKDSLRRFYWYWTRKESIIKALGVNLAYLHRIEINPSLDYFMDNGKRWYVRDLVFGEAYFGAVCSEEIITKEINFCNTD